MIGRRLPRLFFPKRSNSPANGELALARNSIRLHPHAKLGLSLASVLGILIVGCSWSQLNLDAAQESSATRRNSRERRRQIFDDPNVYVRHPPTYTQISERTVSPGDHTGVAQYDTAQFDSTPDRLTDFAASILPVPSGYWSIFSVVSADDPKPASHKALCWMWRNIVPAIAGSLADVHNTNLPPPDADIDEALRQALARLDGDVNADVLTGSTPWARQVSPEPPPSSSPSTLLAVFDSESRVLRVANAGAGRAFLGRPVGGSGSRRYECRELAGSGAPRYLPFRPDEPSRARDVEELIVGDGGRSHGALDAASVEVESVQVRDGDFLVLGPHSTWAHLAGDEAVQSVSGWMREREREQEESPSDRRAQIRGGSEDPFVDFPWKGHRDFGLGWVHTVIPELFRDIDEMFVGVRENAAGRVLQSIKVEQRADDNAHGQDRDASMGPRHLISSLEQVFLSEDIRSCSPHQCANSQTNAGSVMVVVFTDSRK